MTKYNTKKYWLEESHKEELKFELMCRGFAEVFGKAQSIAIEDVQEMVDVLQSSSNNINACRRWMNEAPEEEEE